MRFKYTTALVSLVILFGNPISGFEGGDGSSENPYQIGSCEGLQSIEENKSQNYELVQDIDCSNSEDWNSGRGFDSIGSVECGVITCTFDGFTGVLDGNGHVIRNLYINWGDTYKRQGVFGFIDREGTVKNIGVVNSNVRSNGPTAGLVAGLNGGKVENVFSEGTLVYNGSQRDISYGGLIGNNYNGTLYDNDLRAEIRSSYSIAYVKSSEEIYKGGLVGINQGPIESTYAAGFIQTDNNNKTGGLAGRCGDSEDSFAEGSFSSSYWNVDSSNLSNGYGEGCDESSVTGLSESEFSGSSASSNMQGLDFGSVWSSVTESDEGFDGYPILQSVSKQAQLDAQSNTPPTSDFSLDPGDNVGVGEEIDFTDNSEDADGLVASYSWDFGDGSSSNRQDPSHSYSSAGDYTISLTVTDNDGATDTTSTTVTVQDLNEPPSASFTSDSPVLTDEDFGLNASGSSDPDGDSLSYEWDTNDDGAYGDVTGKTPSVSRNEAGSYNIGLRVSDSNGASDTTEKTIDVENRGPSVSLSKNSSDPLSDESVRFTASANDQDGSISSYDWSIGGSTSTVSNSWSDNGVYTVSVTVTDNEGNTVSDSIEVSVQNRKPIASFTYNVSNPTYTRNISFDASSSRDSDGDISSYEWDWNQDGVYEDSGVMQYNFFDDFGNKEIELRVEDDDGDSEVETRTISVQEKAGSLITDSSPDGRINTDSPEITANFSQKYQINSYSLDLDGSEVLESTNQVKEDSVSYTASDLEDGKHNYTWNVESDSDDFDCINESFTINTNQPPRAVFETEIIGKSHDVLRLNASASSDPDGDSLEYEWDLDGDDEYDDGSGITSNISVKEDSYYNASLIVRDANGRTDIFNETVKVRSEVTTSLAYAPVNPTTEEDVMFEAFVSATSSEDSLSYRWDLDDDGNYDDRRGKMITKSFDNGGKYDVSVSISGNDKNYTSSESVEIVENNFDSVTSNGQKSRDSDTKDENSIIENSLVQRGVIVILLLILMVFVFFESYIPEEGDPLYDFFN